MMILLFGNVPARRSTASANLIFQIFFSYVNFQARC